MINYNKRLNYLGIIKNGYYFISSSIFYIFTLTALSYSIFTAYVHGIYTFINLVKLTRIN